MRLFTRPEVLRHASVLSACNRNPIQHMEVLDMKVLGKALAFVMLLALVGAGTATAGQLN